MESNYILESEEYYECYFCHERFEKGRIYPSNDKYYDAKRMISAHMDTHDVVMELVSQSKTATGLTEIQQIIIPLLGQRKTDDEIAEILKITPSTVRNHRFRLREKEKKARNFLKIMDALHLEEDKLVEPHFKATMQDDRFHLEVDKEKRILSNFFDETGKLKTFPAKEKKKIVIIREIAKDFKVGKVYNEKEVNNHLKRIYEDYATLRRALIEYGYLDRTPDGSVYTRR